jgi:hypothetical protein
VLAVGHSTESARSRLPGTFLVENKGRSESEIGVAAGAGDGEGDGDGDGDGEGLGVGETHSFGKSLQKYAEYA